MYYTYYIIFCIILYFVLWNPEYSRMPHVMITWLPKACRTPEVRKEVAEAVIKAMASVQSAQISPQNLVVRPACYQTLRETQSSPLFIMV